MSNFYEAMAHMEKGGEVTAKGVRYRFDQSTENLMMLEPTCSNWEYVIIKLDDFKADWTLHPILVSWEKAFYAMIVDGKIARLTALSDHYYKYVEGQFLYCNDATNQFIPSTCMAEHLLAGLKWEIQP